MVTDSRTEWNDVAVPLRELARALEENQLAEALRAYDRLERMLARWRIDLETTLGELQEILNA